ncbi:hypothetical protein HYH03_005884 [Edaphochlamys debaryana]|uniref:Uncharacterized protein n=1 Tax=Edaphochlamys debaryana TaxID=47281 RepID=A0A836C1W6_9CHLO|nr:hypothetical protein HYH03_005884 [Edaphochlamys debaryana]|eukprot:KAG2495954.1 hypothetical protein HYH03_005884 [Edaphochlamys debaryana]
MDAKGKKKRSELELLLGNGDSAAPGPFSPKGTLVSPSVPEAVAETDEQLARRLHEELNGMRPSRRGSRAVAVPDDQPASPVTRGGISPLPRAKGDAPKPGVGSSHGVRAPSTGTHPLPTATEAPEEAGSRPGGSGGDGSGAVSGGAAGGGGKADGAGSSGAEGAKRKRNAVPARELHLLLTQASASAARQQPDSALSPNRVRGPSAPPPSMAAHSARPEVAAPSSSHPPPTSAEVPPPGPLPLRESDVGRGPSAGGAPITTTGSSGSAPAAPLPSPSVVAAAHPPASAPPPPPPLLKLKKQYIQQAAAAAAAAAGEAKDRGSTGGATPSSAAAGPGPAVTTTASGVTANCTLTAAHTSLLSGASAEGCSAPVCTAAAAVALPSAAGPGPGTAASGPEPSASVAQAPTGPHGPAPGPSGGPAGPGGSLGGCSSTDETEADHDCAAAVAGAGAGTGGPSATSPKPTGSAGGHGTGAAADGALPYPDPGTGPGEGRPRGPAPLKVPKLPMIRAGRGWYRGRLLRESPDGHRVLVEVPGAPGGPEESAPKWMPAVSDTIWRGSVKGKDWKYLGDGAWEPKPGAFKRGKAGSSCNGLPLPLPAWAVVEGVEPTPAVLPSRTRREREERSSEDADEEAEPQPEPQPEPKPRPAPALKPSKASGGREKRHARRPSPGTAAKDAPVPKHEESEEELGPAPVPVPAPVPAPAPAPAPASVPAEEAPVADIKSEADPSSAAASLGPDPEAVVAAPPAAPCPEQEPAADPVAEVAAVDADAAALMSTEAMELDPIGPETAAEAPAAVEAPATGLPSAVLDAATTAAAEPADVEMADTSRRTSCAGGADVSGAAADASAAAEEEDPIWIPGMPYPRTHAPRRAQPRRRRLRSPLDGMALQHHGSKGLVSGDESGGEAEAGASSDAEGRRGSGDGTGTGVFLGGRRRAAARAAAVAAAAARAEAEAEAEEEEEIALGRRPPRKDRNGHPVAAGAAAAGKRNGANKDAAAGQPAAGRQRYGSSKYDNSYLYGDSSGILDEACGGAEAAVNGGGGGNGTGNGNGAKARAGASSRGGASQPVSEAVGGGSPPVQWDAGQWPTAQAAGVAPAPGSAGAAPVQPRHRRKGLPARARLDGEGDAWCCPEEDILYDPYGGGLWARVNGTLRLVYFPRAVRPANAAGAGEGGEAGAKPKSGRGAYYAQQREREPNPYALPYHRRSAGSYPSSCRDRDRDLDSDRPAKRRRGAYDDDMGASPDDFEYDLDMAIDPEAAGDDGADADYTPPAGSRRCSAPGNMGLGNGRGAYGASYGVYGNAVGGGKRHIVVSYGWASGEEGGGGGCGGGSIAAFAGLLEAALGREESTDLDAARRAEPASAPAADPAATAVGLPAAPEAAVGAAVASHVALSDSSGSDRAPSGEGPEDPRLPPGSSRSGTAGGDCRTLAAECPLLAAAAAEGASALAALAAGAPGPGAGLLSGAGGSSPLPLGAGGLGGPGTPTRARRTGRPPSVALGSGAPMPKLPALSTHASLRMQGSGGGASAASAAAAAAVSAAVSAALAGAGGDPAAAAAALFAPGGGADTLPLLAGATAGTCAQPHPLAALHHDLTHRAGAAASLDVKLECGSAAGGFNLWHGAATPGSAAAGGGGSCDLPPPSSGLPVLADMGICAMDTSGSPIAAPAPPARSPFTAAAAVAGPIRSSPPAPGLSLALGLGAARSGSGGPLTASGRSCAVMEAIGSLLAEAQPAMQQLAIRAQCELDTLGLQVAAAALAEAQQEQALAALAAAAGHQPLSPGAGGRRRNGAVQQRSGSPPVPPYGAGMPYKPHCSTAGTALAALCGANSCSESLLAVLPSAEVVADLFAVRTPVGSNAQQDLADLVAGPAALPFFR